MRVCLALLLALCALPAAAQNPTDLPFTVELVEEDVAGMPGLHSFAWAEHGGKWLFVTGRVDGLHGIVEADPFPDEMANDAVWVVDHASDRVWSRSLDELPDAVADPLRATNAQYHQDGETLYVVGGYGADSATGEKVTFPTLTAIDVPGMIGAVTTGGDLGPHIRQIEDERLAVTGGELRRFYGEYVLFGGHRFDGEYSVGGQGFTQAYTEQIRFFSIDDSATLEVYEGYTLIDEMDALHRRDLNVASTYLLRTAPQGGETETVERYAMYGGVFRPNANLPMRHPVLFDYTDVPVHWQISHYEQQFAHYTCPTLPLFDAETSTMHTTFFGGMAQFVYDEATGETEEDPLVPFTDDIVTLTYEAPPLGALYETVMPEPMPGLLGTNAVFIPAPGVPRSDLGIVRLREVEGRTLVGWIVGGIVSTAPNPGWYGMTDEQTAASDRIFAVYVTPTFDVASEPASAPISIALEAPFPNPFRTEATVAFVLDRPADVMVEVFDVMGRRVALLHDGPLGVRRHAFSFRPGDLPAGVYYARVHGDGFSETRPLVRVR